VILSGRRCVIRFVDGLVEATFLMRDNRFRTTVALNNGSRVSCYLPNSGRLRELLEPGRRVLLRPVTSSSRTTGFDLVLVDVGGTLVSTDARLPNTLVAEALRADRLAPFTDYDHVLQEVRYHESRLDFVLLRENQRCFIEVKSVTLVEEGLALFPDSPTTRGHRHVQELRRAVSEGDRAAVIFVVQREDAQAFTTNDKSDPQFAQALVGAIKEGVEVYAYGCRVSRNQVRLDRPLEIRIPCDGRIP
jgi:sugar fermentation stimulation protein A